MGQVEQSPMRMSTSKFLEPVNVSFHSKGDSGSLVQMRRWRGSLGKMGAFTRVLLGELLEYAQPQEVGNERMRPKE